MEKLVLFNNAPIVSDDYVSEAHTLDAQINRPEIKNVAVVATYGAGKSSAIDTYLNKYRKRNFLSRFFKPKHIKISLADFNDETVYDESAIERSILQQLLYSQKKNKLPNSKIERTNKSMFWFNAILSVAILFFISAITLLTLNINGIDVINIAFNWEFKYWNAAYLITIAISGTFLMFLMFYFRKLKKVKYKDLEAELNSTTLSAADNGISLFNRFIDEVLYFFECINLDLVIFEDLDRFNDLKIFVKLRELNTVINNGQIKPKKVTFLYAVKDDMFKDEKERAKFFEFIMPIFPIINPITTEDRISEMHNQIIKYNSDLKLTEKFIQDISYFVSDMRVLKNAFNDYVLSAQKILLSGDNKANTLKNENLFALCLYKNLFPYDYILLQKNEGLIPQLVNKDYLSKTVKEELEDKIKELEVEIEKIEKEKLEDFNELKLIFTGRFFDTDNDGDRSKAVTIDKLDTFKDINNLTLLTPYYAKRGYHNYYFTVSNPTLPNGETYYDRELRIHAKNNNKIDSIKKEIADNKKSLSVLREKTFSELVIEYGTDLYFSDASITAAIEEYNELITNKIFKGKLSVDYKEELENKLKEQLSYIRMLIHNNYIDDNYIEYTSNYRTSIISLNDRAFMKDVKRGVLSEFNRKIDDIEVVIKKLREEEIGSASVLIFQVLNAFEIIKKIDSEEGSRKGESLLKLLYSDEQSILDGITEYYKMADTDSCYRFTKFIIRAPMHLWEKLFASNALEKETYDNIIVCIVDNAMDFSNFAGESVVSYINHLTNYYELFLMSDIDKVKKFITDLVVRFDSIDASNLISPLNEFIISGDHYVLNIDNVKIACKTALSDDFYKRNYTYIQENASEVLKDNIQSHINEYLKLTYLKLPDNDDSREVCDFFLNSEVVDLKNKQFIIEKTDNIFENLEDYEERLLETLVTSNKVIPSWHNILYAYENLGLDEKLKSYILHSANDITGTLDDVDESLRDSFVHDLLNTEYTVAEQKMLDTVFTKLNIIIDLTDDFNIDDNLAMFIKANRIKYNVEDFAKLSEKPKSLLAYVILYQQQILESGTFFDDSLDGVLIDNIILTKDIKDNLKKKVITDFMNIIDPVKHCQDYAAIILKLNIPIPETFLYKFTESSLDSETKLSLLCHLISTEVNIRDLKELKNYLSNLGGEIGNAFTAIYKDGENKCKIIDTEQTRKVVELLKQKNVVTYKPRTHNLHLTIVMS